MRIEHDSNIRTQVWPIWFGVIPMHLLTTATLAAFATAAVAVASSTSCRLCRLLIVYENLNNKYMRKQITMQKFRLSTHTK